MPMRQFTSLFFRALLVAGLMTAATGVARAQVAALVNGSPITQLDIDQRTKLMQISAGKAPPRQQVLEELVNEQLKIFAAKRYILEVTEKDIDGVFANMAQRSHLSTAQMEQSLSTRGIAVSTLRGKIKADIIWNQIVRGKFSSTLQIGEPDIRAALQARKEEDKTVGYVYTIYPIVMVGPRGNDAELAARIREAEALRARFQSCAEGLSMVRAMRDVVVRDRVVRSSSEFTSQIREILEKVELGHLTTPDPTPQGLQMFAVCERKESSSESPAKRAVREEIFNQRFEEQSKKYLEEIRRSSMIEYR
jgi:peptidyl-prolyl cis-trans isomerase SurA